MQVTVGYTIHVCHITHSCQILSVYFCESFSMGIFITRTHMLGIKPEADLFALNMA